MQRTSAYPGVPFDGFTTGNRDRDSREDDIRPDYHDYDQLAAEIVALETVGGPSGPTGPSGPSGPTGPSGPSGPTGPSGPSGPTGPSGPSGPTGPSGPSGPTGPSGPDGPSGPSGPTGPSGPSGPTGPSGPSGPSGPDSAAWLPAQPANGSNSILAIDANGVVSWTGHV
jgi:hypothetical protein